MNALCFCLFLSFLSRQVSVAAVCVLCEVWPAAEENVTKH